MGKTGICAVLLACLMSSTAAQATPSATFGNTLQITGEDGSVKLYYLNADGSYTGVLPGSLAVAGTWIETATQLCFTQQKPSRGTQLCGPKITQSVGDTWSSQRPDGSASQLTIRAGRP